MYLSNTSTHNSFTRDCQGVRKITHTRRRCLPTNRLHNIVGPNAMLHRTQSATTSSGHHARLPMNGGARTGTASFLKDWFFSADIQVRSVWGSLPSLSHYLSVSHTSASLSSSPFESCCRIPVPRERACSVIIPRPLSSLAFWCPCSCFADRLPSPPALLLRLFLLLSPDPSSHPLTPQVCSASAF